MNWKIILTACIFLYCLYYASSLEAWHFIDNANLVIHEAGHIVFIPFGYFITVAGGTLLQIIIPAMFIGYFVWKEKQYSASLLVYWLAINFFNISVYAGDAVKRQLPLITGDADSHDWNQMLFYLGWLKHTILISHIIFILGVIALLAALIWGISTAKRKVATSEKFDI